MAEDTGISQQAFDRIKHDLEKANARTAELEGLNTVAKDKIAEMLGRQAYLEYRAQDDPTLQRVVAELSFAGPQLRSVADTDDLQAQVEKVAKEIDTLRGPAQVTSTNGEGEEAPAPAQTATPFDGPNPNPGASGLQPKPEKLNAEQVAQLARDEGMAGVRAAVEAGQIEIPSATRDRHGI